MHSRLLMVGDISQFFFLYWSHLKKWYCFLFAVECKLWTLLQCDGIRIFPSLPLTFVFHYEFRHEIFISHYFRLRSIQFLKKSGGYFRSFLQDESFTFFKRRFIYFILIITIWKNICCTQISTRWITQVCN